MQSLTSAATSPSAVAEVIRVRGLTFTYPKATEPALRGMDFTVGRGEIFGFLGPSGAGKSGRHSRYPTHAVTTNGAALDPEREMSDSCNPSRPQPHRRAS